MLKINELKQKALDHKGALNVLLEQQSGSKAKVTSLLEAQLANAATDESKKAVAAAKAEAQALDEKIATTRALVTSLEEQIHAEEQRIATETAAVVARVGHNVETHDNRQDEPWIKAGEPTSLRLGRFAQAVHRAGIGHGVDPRLHKAAASGMGTASGPDGGFAVPVEDSVAIEREMFEGGQLLSRVETRTISGNAIKFTAIKQTSRVDGSRDGGVLGYWIDEGTAPDASQIKLEKIEMELKKVGTLGYVTEELAADAAALGGELQSALRDELMFQVENKVWRGSGAGCPIGFTVAPCLVSVAKEAGQAARTITPGNLSAMWARMPARSKANAVWFINVDCEPQLDELALPIGTAALEPRFVNYGPDGILRIKGRPVIPVEYAETLGTVGDIALVDLSRYRLIRKATGIEQTSSIHVRFSQGEETFRGIYRVDGQPIPRAAMTPFKGSATLSPFIVLATRG